jgi:hypothetical protein
MNDEYEFAEGDTVLVRVRETRQNGPLRAKFVADVESIRETELGGDTVTLDMGFGDSMNTIRLKPYQAEFEVVDGIEEVKF